MLTPAAILALATALPIPDNCGGDPGYTLTNPATVEIGSSVPFTIQTPMTTLNVLMFSLGEGPTDFGFACVCVDFPPLVRLDFVLPGGGPITLEAPVPCDENIVGLTIYQQFIGIDVNDRSNVGVSNQTSLDIVAPGGFSDSFPDFSDVSELTLNGFASQQGNVLRLTDDQLSQGGSAYYTQPMTIDENTSFSTSFTFRVHGTPNGADGLAFVVQGNDATALGGHGGGLGFEGVDNSIAVEVDTWSNGAFDPSANHIGVLWDGDSRRQRAFHNPPFNLEDEDPHFIWVDYCGVTNTLEVYLSDDDPNKPADPVITHSVDLFARTGDTAYFGFCGATGGVSNTHDIESWEFRVW